MLIKEEVFGLIRVQPKRNYSIHECRLPFSVSWPSSWMKQMEFTFINDIKFSNRVWNDPFNICKKNEFLLAFYKLNELTHAE